MPLRTSSNNGDGWRDLFILVATLFLGSFFVILVAASAGASGRSESTLQSVFGVLAVGLGYALIATISGLIPLFLYSFVYTFCVIRCRITYFGVAALAAGVVMFFEMAFQAASSSYRASPWGMTMLGCLHALPTALIAHFITKRRHRRKLGAEAMTAIRPSSS